MVLKALILQSTSLELGSITLPHRMFSPLPLHMNTFPFGHLLHEVDLL